MTNELNPFDVAPEVGIHGPVVTHDLNQASNTSEASLMQGLESLHTAEAIAASGTDQKATAEAAAHFAQKAHAAIANGKPLSHLPADANLSAAAQAAIYEQVAQQQGTSAHAIEEKAKEAAARDMAAVQGMMGGLIGGALAEHAAAEPALSSPYVLSDAERRNQPLTTEAALAAMGADIPKTAGLPGQQRQQSQGRG